MIMCKYPRDKDKDNYMSFVMKAQKGEFSNQEDLEEMEKEVFYKDPKEFLIKMAVGFSIPALFMNPKQYEYPLEPPFVNLFLGDYMYLGFCLEISLESIRQDLISKGNLTKSQVDASFDAVFWIKVR